MKEALTCGHEGILDMLSLGREKDWALSRLALYQWDRQKHFLATTVRITTMGDDG